MNMKLLCEKLTSRPELRDIPLVYIFKVANAVFEIIEEGGCFYDTEEKECLSNITQIQLQCTE